MALREILILPDKRLRKVSEPVKKIDAGIRRLVEDMFETMYDAPGIGLAAIQIGTAKRVITMDLAKKEEPKNPQVFINPEIVWSSDETATHEEGCLSIPETYDDVERPARVKVKYLDLEGASHEVEANGLLSHLPAARDRPSQRHSVHRPPVQAQARHDHQEIHQGCQARRVRSQGFMSALVIRNINRRLMRRLETNARKNGRSVSQEAKILLEKALPESGANRRMGTALLELVPKRYRGDDLIFEIPSDLSR